jgi:hypothetical protein
LVVVKNVQKSLGPKIRKRTLEDGDKLELDEAKKLAIKKQAKFLRAIQRPFDLICQLLIGEARTQWYKIVKETFKHDPCIGGNGKLNPGKCLQTWKSFVDCIKLYKLTVLLVGATEKQRFYIQQVVRKPQRIPVRQYMSRMGVLNDYIAYLPSIFYSLMAVASLVRGNVSFGNGELASTILASTQHAWQNQYNLMHSTVPELPCTLLPDLEAIERIMNKKYVEKQRPRARLMQLSSAARAVPTPRKGCLGARLIESQRRLAVRSFASVARLTAILTRCTTPASVAGMTRMECPLAQPQVSPPKQRSPTRSLGATSRWRT